MRVCACAVVLASALQVAAALLPLDRLPPHLLPLMRQVVQSHSRRCCKQEGACVVGLACAFAAALLLSASLSRQPQLHPATGPWLAALQPGCVLGWQLLLVAEPQVSRGTACMDAHASASPVLEPLLEPLVHVAPHLPHVAFPDLLHLRWLPSRVRCLQGAPQVWQLPLLLLPPMP